MTIDPWILTFSAVTVFATIFMGFWSARRSKTASDFFVAGRSVSVGWNASAISGEYLSAASFMGVAGMVMSSGYDALWYPVCYACGYLFLLLFIAGPLRRFGAYTIPDFAEGRFDSPVFRKIAVVFVLFIGFFYTMPQMKGAGTTLAYIFPGLPYWAGVVLVGAVITLNVALGGMKGITLVQAFQYWAKMFAISVPIFVLMAVYGHYGKQVGVNGVNSVDTTSGAISPYHSIEELKSAFPNLLMSGPMRAGYGVPPSLSDALRTPSPTKLERVEIAAEDSLGLNQMRSKSPHASPEILIEVYSALTGQEVTLGAKVEFRKSVSLDTTKFATKSALRAELERLLEGYGLRLLRLNATQAVWLDEKSYREVLSGKRLSSPATESISLRKPLPEKAPADASWLSPFGPLTTKAARAAKPEPHYTGPLLASAFGSAIENVTGRLIDKLSETSGAGNFKFDPELVVSFPPTNRSAFELVLTSTMERQYTRRISEIRYSPELTNLFIYWPPETQQIKAKDFSKTLHSVLSSNGVTVVEEGSVVTAFLTKDAKIIPINPRPYSLLYTYSLIIALVCGTAGLPHILVRFYTNPDGVAAKRTTMWVMILIGCFYVFPPVFGVMGRNLMPQLYEGVGAKGTDKVVLELPRILNEQRGGGERERRGKGEAARGGEVPSAPLPLFSSADANAKKPSGGIPWGSILSGVTCAGAFAAFMSTFSGLLVSMTGAMAHDVYGRMLRPKATQEQRLRAFKVCTVIIGGIAIVLGCFVEPLEINFMVGQAFAIAAASYFPLLFMSVWWRGMTMRGAATGMLSGGLCALAAVTLTNFSNLALDKGPMGKLFSGFAPMNEYWAHHPLLRILCEQPAIWTVPLAIGLMIVVSKRTRQEVPGDVRMKMLVLHAPEKLGLKQEYIQEHQPGH